MSDVVLEAAPLTRAQIIDLAEKFRAGLGLNAPYLPVPQVLEHILPRAYRNYEFEVRSRTEMGERHGLWDPFEKVLALREDVYEGVVAGQGRDRSTGMHEVGHAILHPRATLNRVLSDVSLAAFRDPEWQAQTFSAAVLMPPRVVSKCRSISEVAVMFGVSLSHAQVWVTKAGIILNSEGVRLVRTASPLLHVARRLGAAVGDAFEQPGFCIGKRNLRLTLKKRNKSAPGKGVIP